MKADRVFVACLVAVFVCAISAFVAGCADWIPTRLHLALIVGTGPTVGACYLGWSTIRGRVGSTHSTSLPDMLLADLNAVAKSYTTEPEALDESDDAVLASWSALPDDDQRTLSEYCADGGRPKGWTLTPTSIASANETKVQIATGLSSSNAMRPGVLEIVPGVPVLPSVPATINPAPEPTPLPPMRPWELCTCGAHGGIEHVHLPEHSCDDMTFQIQDSTHAIRFKLDDAETTIVEHSDSSITALDKLSSAYGHEKFNERQAERLRERGFMIEARFRNGTAWL